jgi:hypothetical protein
MIVWTSVFECCGHYECLMIVWTSVFECSGHYECLMIVWKACLSVRTQISSLCENTTKCALGLIIRMLNGTERI